MSEKSRNVILKFPCGTSPLLIRFPTREATCCVLHAASDEVALSRGSTLICRASLLFIGIAIDEAKRQHASLKFNFLLERTAAETASILRTAYKVAATNKAQVYEWFSCYRNGHSSLEDQPHSGRPSTFHHENI